MSLVNPTETFESIRSSSVMVSQNWGRIVLPHNILTTFSVLWRETIGYPCEISRDCCKLYTSAENSEIINHSDLALAITTYPLREILISYKHTILRIVNDNDIETFRNDFRQKPVNGNVPNWNVYENAIRASNLSAEDQNSLIEFLTLPENFYEIKGISREDFETPALCKSIGKRIDRFSICSQISSCVTTELYQSVIAYISSILSASVVDKNTFGSNSFHPLLQALLTKPFAILTGASGTGKTRLAESLAKSYACGDTSRYAVVAVGADWTDNRHVLGFVNHLREIDGLSSYQSTPVLDLLLHADAESEVPHFLVLDEMNLSHVERYFADFLSAMERPDGRLNLHNSGADAAKLPRYQGDTGRVPRSMLFPKNLFVIGTVNVDETTYMFSPKVLDRANVIEFRMSDKDLDLFLQGDGTYPETQAATEEQASAFLAAAKEKELDPLPIMATASDHLKKIFALMEKARFEFGYRATGEVIRYLKICRAHAVDQTAWDGAGWLQDFDHQILQKLLPRLHGGMGRMGPLLTGLGHFCHGTALPPQARIDSLESLDPSTARFPKSFAKISSMAEVLREEQFVSFIC